MAKRHKQARLQEGVDVDLTPMIDVVFLLIIFFILVTTITTQDNVILRLPDALAANETPENAPQPFIVHIAPADQDVDVPLPDRFGYFCHGQPTPRAIREMESILIEQADRIDPLAEYTGRGPDGISENEIVIRCDARAPAQYFGQLIELMAQIKIYKIKVAILKDPRLE